MAVCFSVVNTTSTTGCFNGELGDPTVAERDPGDQDRPSVDAGTAPDAEPASEQPDAGPPNPDCTDQTTNLLTNPSFDNGPQDWLQNSALEIVVTAPELVHTPQSPAHAAWLGGFSPATQAFAQRHTIPADAKSVAVRGFRLIKSDDQTANQDVLGIYILDATGNVLELLSDPAVACPGCTYSNTAGLAEAFTAFQLPVTGNYAGQEILFHVQSDLADDPDNTNFYFDTMALDVTVCR